METRQKLVCTALAALFFGCRGEEVARVKLAQAGDSADTKWVVSGGQRKAQVWAEYNGKWTGKHPGVVYEVELLDGEKSVTKMDCNSASCSSNVCGSTTTVNNDHSGDCECKTSCVIEAPADGTFTVKATVKSVGTMTESKDISIILRKP